MLEGTQLGPYQILEEVARGGMGVVYRAVDPRSGHEVALKVLTSQKAGQRFEREVGALARVQHPNVVPVLNCGLYLDHPWVAMAFVPGVTLQDRLEQRGPITPGLAVSWIAKLARAIAAVHDTGVVHRDIKPANVILTPTGEPVLTDFGLALDSTANERLSMDGATLGSPGYFSPEQAVGDLSRIDVRSDVYGLGATLYALLTARAPIPLRGSLVEVIVATQEKMPEPPSSWNQRVDAGLDRICMKCLAKKPADRQRSAIALALELERYLHDGQVKPRRRWLTGAWVVVPLLVVGGLVGAASVMTNAEPNPNGATDLTERLEAAEANLELLDVAYEDERYQEVINELEDFAEHPKASPKLLQMLARCYGQLNRNEPALVVTRRLIVEAPSPKAYLIHGVVMLGLQQGDDAMAAFERGLELDPERKTESALLGNRAMCRIQNGGDVALSLDDWERSLALLDPEDVNAERYFNLGVLNGMLEHWERAIEAYGRCLELDPKHKGAYYNLAVTLSDLGRLDQAEDTLLELKQLDPLFGNVEFRLAWIHMRRAEELAGIARVEAKEYLTRAMEHFNEHLLRDPRDSAGYQGRGLCHARLGELAEAEADLKLALDYCASSEQEERLRREIQRVQQARATGEY